MRTLRMIAMAAMLDLECEWCRLDFFIAKIEENIPEKEATTYLGNKMTGEEPSWAVIRPKSMKKLVKYILTWCKGSQHK